MIEMMLDYAMRFIGTPYVYGGNNPVSGMDCSGFVCEILKAVSVIPGHKDFSARELYVMLQSTNGCRVSKSVKRGSILFFGKNINTISHIAIAINDKLMIESGGGDAGTISKEKAALCNAFVRIRPIRSDLVGTIEIN